MADVLTRDGFTQWVQDKDEDAVVGTSCRADSCPLATYLRAQGYPEARVRDEYYCLDGLQEFSTDTQAEHYPLAPWMVRLIRAVDDNGLSALEPVRAQEVRTIMAALGADED